MGKQASVGEERPGVDVEAVKEQVTFTCPACDKPQTSIKGKKRYLCCFCHTETSRKVAKEAGCLTKPNVKERYDKWDRKFHTKELDRLNRREPTKSSGRPSASKRKKSSSRK